MTETPKAHVTISSSEQHVDKERELKAHEDVTRIRQKDRRVRQNPIESREGGKEKTERGLHGARTRSDRQPFQFN